MFREFGEFADALRGHDNLNTVPMQGGYPARHRFMKALVGKAGIEGEVKLSPQGCAQPTCRLIDGDQIYIEVLGEVNPKDGAMVGTYQTWTINSDWSVVKGTRPYRVPLKKN